MGPFDHYEEEWYNLAGWHYMNDVLLASSIEFKYAADSVMTIAA